MANEGRECGILLKNTIAEHNVSYKKKLRVSRATGEKPVSVLRSIAQCSKLDRFRYIRLRSARDGT